MSQVEDVRGIARRLVDVVRDHDDGDIVTEVDELDQVVHLPCRDRVEARDGLVEQQQFFCRAQRPGEQYALLLAAGEGLIAFVLQILDPHALQISRCALPVLPVIGKAPAQRVETAGQHDLPHAGGKIALDIRLLRQIADLGFLQPVAQGDFSL